MSEWRRALALILWVFVCAFSALADDGFDDPLRDQFRAQINKSIRNEVGKTVKEAHERFERARADAKLWFGKNAYAGHSLKFLGTGLETLRERIDLIRSAESSIYLATFKLVNDDTITQQISDWLCYKAQHGVDVRILVDEWASKELRESWGSFYDCGIKIFFFGKAWWGIENILDGIHEKLLIVDGKSVVIGGSNYGLHYYFAKRTSTEWHDMDVRIDGPAACDYMDHFAQTWRKGVEIERGARFSAMVGSSNDDEFLETLYDTESLHYCTMPKREALSGGSKVMPLEVNPRIGDKNVLLAAYAELFLAADDYIWIYSPYLMMHEDFMLALQAAAARGVAVHVLTNSKESNDEANAMSLLIYKSARELIRRGIHVHEWTGSNTLHRKGMLIDGKYSVMGSHNFDRFGGKHMSEAIAISDDPELAKRLHAELLADVKRTRVMTPKSIEKRLKAFTRWDRLKAKVVGKFL